LHGCWFLAGISAPLPSNQKEEFVMSDLVVIEFPSEAKAEEVREKLLNMQNEYLIELEDAVVAVSAATPTSKALSSDPAKMRQSVARDEHG
jgi:uncharacterized membrane protein